MVGRGSAALVGALLMLCPPGVGQISVSDGGADGDADTTIDNSVFPKQGLFVP